MPADHSFDIVAKVDLTEIDNAYQQALKEIGNRWDFVIARCRQRLAAVQ